MFNKIILVGNLTRDIELRYAPSGTAIGSTGLATSRKFKSNTGEQKEEVMFIDITFFGRTAEIANQYLKKGSKVLVEGRLKLDSWTDQSGGKRSKHSVTIETMQMLDSKGAMTYDENAGESHGYEVSHVPQSQPESYRPAPKQKSAIPEIDINDDEIPF